MGIKKIARPINKAKNDFIQWLKDRDGEMIEQFEGDHDHNWDYYRHVDAFIGDVLYSVYFMIWNGKIGIDYSDSENSYNDLTVEEFLELIR